MADEQEGNWDEERAEDRFKMGRLPSLPVGRQFKSDLPHFLKLLIYLWIRQLKLA
jgi:hypothetical protein